MFISFAPPKEMNQRKGGRKCQLQPKRAPATQAIKALPFWLKFTPFPVCPRASIYQIMHHYDIFGISNGLREFWDKATILRLAAKVCGKQYCPRRDPPAGGDDELYCVGKRKNNCPKILCSLELSLVTFFVSRQRK